MTTTVLETFSVASVLDAPASQTAEDMIVRGIKVFKVGRFRNSRGQWGEWSAEMLQAAVDNFNHLRRTRVFPDVPVRLDHSKSIRDLVGYFHEMHFDGTFLTADVMFTKKSAFEEYNAGHLRNVSLEIGQYETNDEVMYDHVVQGLAFVDIPAVEGLHQRPTGEDTMATETKGSKAGDEGEGTTPAPEQPAPAPQPNPEVVPAPTDPPSTEPPAPAAPVEPPAEHSRGAVQTFRVNGGEVSDFSAVQAHINSLEKFRNDTRSSLRDSFVDDLAKGGKIGNPQVEPMKLHVKDLSDEQFTAFRMMYDAMPGNNLFAKHDTTTDPSTLAGQDAADSVFLARETVAQFRRMGKDEEFIQRQPAWAVVQAADAAK